MNIYFLIAGIENAKTPFKTKFTFIDLCNNTGHLKNTELFFALTELHGIEIEEIRVGQSVWVQTNRDNESSKAILSRVNFETYESFII
jgi:hypothetical protein